MFASLDVFACICLKQEPIDSTFKEASIIFVGKVTEIIEDKLYVSTKDRDGYIIANFEIVEGFKNCDGENKTISIVTDNSSCASYFEEGKMYVVFGYSDAAGILRTNKCTRTGLLEEYKNTDLAKVKELSVYYKDEGIGALGLVTLTQPEYNSLVNKIIKIEADKKTLMFILAVLATLLIFSVGLNFYSRRRNKIPTGNKK